MEHYNESDNSFPDQIDPVLNKDYYKRCIDYAKARYLMNRNEIDRIIYSKRSFNGYTRESLVNFLNNVYGSASKAKYVDYKLSKSKLTRLFGEWLQLPLRATVQCINSTSRLEQKKIQDIKAAMNHPLVKEKVQRLREFTSADPYNGKNFDDEDDLWSGMNPKSKNEFIMQTILNKKLTEGIKDQLYMCFQDIVLASRTAVKVSMDSYGNTSIRPIPAEYMMFEETENDIFLRNSPYLGEKRLMPYHQIMLEFNLSKDDIRKLKAISNGVKPDYEGLDSMRINGNHLFNVYTIEFYVYEPHVYKVMNDGRYIGMDKEYYEEYKKKIHRDESRKRFKIEKRYKQYVHQVTLIEDDIYVNYGPVKNIVGSVNEPFYSSLNYKAMLFDTINGMRISLNMMLEEIKIEYNVVRMLINRELYKYKGMIIGYDRAYLPRDDAGNPVPKKYIVSQMVNDGIFDYNSAGDNNFSNRNIEIGNIIQSADLGLSSSFNQLIQLAYNLEDLASKITGFNAEREGATPPSSTVTNAINNLQNSKNITAPIFYFFDRFSERVMLHLVELEKIAYAYIRKEEGRNLLNTDKNGIIEVTPDIAKDDYCVYLADSRREEMIRQRMSARMDQAINAGEMRIQDAYNAELAETLVEAREIVNRGWNEIKQIQMQMEREKAQLQQQAAQVALQTAREDREDKQTHEANMAVLKAALDRGASEQEAIQQFILNEQMADIQQQMEQQQQI